MKTRLVESREVLREVRKKIEKADWQVLLRIYRAAVDPDAELEEQMDSSYLIRTKAPYPEPETPALTEIRPGVWRVPPRNQSPLNPAKPTKKGTLV